MFVNEGSAGQYFYRYAPIFRDQIANAHPLGINVPQFYTMEDKDYFYRTEVSSQMAIKMLSLLAGATASYLAYQVLPTVTSCGLKLISDVFDACQKGSKEKYQKTKGLLSHFNNQVKTTSVDTIAMIHSLIRVRKITAQTIQDGVTKGADNVATLGNKAVFGLKNGLQEASDLTQSLGGAVELASNITGEISDKATDVSAKNLALVGGLSLKARDSAAFIMDTGVNTSAAAASFVNGALDDGAQFGVKVFDTTLKGVDYTNYLIDELEAAVAKFSEGSAQVVSDGINTGGKLFQNTTGLVGQSFDRVKQSTDQAQIFGAKSADLFAKGINNGKAIVGALQGAASNNALGGAADVITDLKGAAVDAINGVINTSQKVEGVVTNAIGAAGDIYSEFLSNSGGNIALVSNGIGALKDKAISINRQVGAFVNKAGDVGASALNDFGNVAGIALSSIDQDKPLPSSGQSSGQPSGAPSTAPPTSLINKYSSIEGVIKSTINTALTQQVDVSSSVANTVQDIVSFANTNIVDKAASSYVSSVDSVVSGASAIADVAGDVADMVIPVSEQTRDMLVHVFNQNAIGYGAITDAAKQFCDAAEMAQDGFKQIAINVVPVVPNLISGVEPAVTGLLKFGADNAHYMTDIAGGVLHSFDLLEPPIESALKASATGATGLLHAIAAGVVGGVSDSVSDLAVNATNTAVDVASKLPQFVDPVASAAKTAVWVGQKIEDIGAYGVTSALGVVGQIASADISLVNTAFNISSKGVQSGVDVATVLTSAGGDLLKVMTDPGTQVANIINDVVKTAGSAFNTEISNTNSNIQSFLTRTNYYVGLSKPLPRTIRDAILHGLISSTNAAVPAVKFVSTVVNVAGQGGKVVASEVGVGAKMFNAASSAITTAENEINSIESTVMSEVNAITKPIQDSVNWLTGEFNSLNSAFQDMKGYIDGVSGWIDSAVNSVVDGLLDVVNQAGDWLADNL